jgi:hypothetical protein
VSPLLLEQQTEVSSIGSPAHTLWLHRAFYLWPVGASERQIDLFHFTQRMVIVCYATYCNHMEYLAMLLISIEDHPCSPQVLAEQRMEAWKRYPKAQVEAWKSTSARSVQTESVGKWISSLKTMLPWLTLGSGELSSGLELIMVMCD